MVRAGVGAATVTEFRGDITIQVPADRVIEVLGWLRDAPGGTPMLTDLTAVDRSPAEPRFEVIYQLTGYDPPVRVRVKVAVPDGAPVVASATRLWAGANWLERECFDMFGIVFAGHPNLKRMLLPDDWAEGHPLRKDYPLRGWSEFPVYNTERTVGRVRTRWTGRGVS